MDDAKWEHAPSWRRQFTAMMKKNYLLKRRVASQTCCECATPILLTLLLVLGWRQSLTQLDINPDVFHANSSFPLGSLVGGITTQALSSTIYPNGTVNLESPVTRAVLNALGVNASDPQVQNLLIGRNATDIIDLANTTGTQALANFNGTNLERLLGPNATALLAANGIDLSQLNTSTLPVNTIFQTVLTNALVAITNGTIVPPIAGANFTNQTQDANSTTPGLNTIASEFLNYFGPVPTFAFDTYVALHKALAQLISSQNGSLSDTISRLSLADNRFGNLIHLGRVLFAPRTPEVSNIAEVLKRKYVYFNEVYYDTFETENDAVNFALRDWTKEWKGDINDQRTSELRTWAVIVFNRVNLTEGLLDYTIRMNYSTLPSTKNVYNRFQIKFDTGYQKYYLSGFMTLQNMIEELLLDDAPPNRGIATAQRQPLLRTASFTSIPFPVAAYVVNNFYTFGALLGLVLCMSILYPLSRFIKALVEEKESRTKETMKIMGLRDSVFISSWFATYFIFFLLVVFLMAGILANSVFRRTSGSLIFAFFFLYATSMLCFAFLVSTFFSKAKLAGIVGPLITFACSMPRYAFVTFDETDLVGAKYFTCILSPSAFVFGAELFLSYEGANSGLNWQVAWEDPMSIGGIMGMMFFDCFLYMGLALYFEYVLPNEYGTRQPPWFFLLPSFWSPKKMHFDEPEPIKASPSIEAVPDELKPQRLVTIRHLRKVWTHGWGKGKKEVTAVADLSLDLYEGQILSLLGHNGAGKTTTISMLTGLIPPTGGDVLINGFELRSQMSQIRQSVGICPQHNVLFPTLTVAEHLRHYAVLKGVPAEHLDREVAKKIQEVGLQDKTDTYSSALSGGMQRRLSVAIALIGNPKIVFLDEPTSGMDPYARRATWELLRANKQGRAMVLTTHFMDEADLLGDRIAIMAKGTMQTAGTSLFLKTRYGVGYNLIMVREREVAVDQLVNMVQSFVPDATVLNVSGGEIAFRLPLTSVGRFAALFKHLEERRHELGIGGYGISMTTLEEVFIRLSQLAENGEEPVNEEVIRKNHRLSVLAPMTAIPKEATADPQGGAAGAEGEHSHNSKEHSWSGKARGEHHDSEVKEAIELKNFPDQERDQVPRASPAELQPKDTLNLETGSTDTLAAGATGGGTRDSKSASASAEGLANTTLLPQEGSLNKAVDSPVAAESSITVQVPQPVTAAAKGKPASLPVQLKELLRKRYLFSLRDPKGRVFEVLLPIIIVILVLLILLINNNPAGPSIVLDGKLYQNARLINKKRLITESFAGMSSPVQEFRGFEAYPDLLGYLQHPNSTMNMIAVPAIDNAMDMSLYLFRNRLSGRNNRFAAYVLNDTSLSQQFPAPLLQAEQLLQGVNVSELLANATVPTIVVPPVPSNVTNPVITIPTAALIGAINAITQTLANANVTNTTTAVNIPAFQIPIAPGLAVLAQIENLGNQSSTVVTIPNTNTSFVIPTNLLNPTVNVNGTQIPLDLFLTNVLETTYAANASVAGFTVGPNNEILFGGQSVPVSFNVEVPIQALANFSTTVIDPLTNQTIVVPTFNQITIPVFNPATNTTTQVPLFPTTPTTAPQILNDTQRAAVQQATSNFLQQQLNQAYIAFDQTTRTTAVLHNASAWHAIVCYATEFMKAKLMYAYNSTNVTYILRNHPLPLTAQGTLQRQATLSVISAVFLLVPFCYLPASFVIFIVKERNSKAKHLQLVSGVNQIMYWVSHYLWDLFNYLIICCLVLIVFVCYNNANFVGDTTTAGATFLVFWLYGLAVFPLSYALTFMFRNHVSAQIGIAGIHFVLGFILVITDFVLDGLESTVETNKKLKPLYRIFPPYLLGNSLTQLSGVRLRILLTGVELSPFAWDICGRALVCLVIEAVAYFVLTLLVEYKAFEFIWTLCDQYIIAKIQRKLFPKQYASKELEESFLPAGVEDEDVVREAERVKNGEAVNDLVVLNRLRKVFEPRGNGKRPTVAVNDISLGIAPSTCFGFLGINGAGKTTTMSILTGDINASSGTAHIRGLDVATQLQAVRREVGYCPQFDPLLDLLTAREHLNLFARLRGIPESEVAGVVQSLIQQVGLVPFADIVSQAYSGGNKRKLSLALALVGGPAVVFLDEPSTGMDPVSRRFMWDVISEIKKQRSVVLTTHSMEECEALCSRICIMVGGRLQCLGSIQHIKSKYGSGYQMELTTAIANIPRVKKFIEGLFEGAEVEEEHAGRLKYRLPAQKLSLSAIFGALEAEKDSIGLVEYSVSQCTLEQIFVAIARAKDHEQPQLDPAQPPHDPDHPRNESVRP